MLIKFSMPRATTMTDLLWNLMQAVFVTSTTAANTTPTITRVSTSNVANTQASLLGVGPGCFIEEVISNTESGGWTLGPNNNFTQSVVPAATVGSYILHLQTSNGKANTKYFAIGCGGVAAGSGGASVWSTGTQTINDNNNSWPNYGVYDVGYGSLQRIRSMEGLNDGSFLGSDITRIRKYTPGSGNAQWSRNISAASPFSLQYFANRYSVSNFDAATRTPFYVGATENYIFLVHEGAIWYFGTRTSQPWEDAYTDNPYYVSFGHAGTAANTTHSYHETFSNLNHVLGPPGVGVINRSFTQAFSRTISTANTNYTSSPPMLYYNTVAGNQLEANSFWTVSGNQNAYGSEGFDAISMQFGRAQSTAQVNLRANSNNALSGTHIHNTWDHFNAPFDGPSFDTTTGLMVPTIYPINFSVSGNSVNSGGNSGGRALGIYKGQLGIANNSPLLNLASYIIDGSNHIPVFVGNSMFHSANTDLYFIRAA